MPFTIARQGEFPARRRRLRAGRAVLPAGAAVHRLFGLAEPRAPLRDRRRRDRAGGNAVRNAAPAPMTTSKASRVWRDAAGSSALTMISDDNFRARSSGPSSWSTASSPDLTGCAQRREMRASPGDPRGQVSATLSKRNPCHDPHPARHPCHGRHRGGLEHPRAVPVRPVADMGRLHLSASPSSSPT